MIHQLKLMMALVIYLQIGMHLTGMVIGILDTSQDVVDLLFGMIMMETVFYQK